jgi:transcriptional regulator with XRE-family HTH domain
VSDLSASERPDFYVDLGAIIRDERIAANVTQESLAEAVGLSRTSIVNIEAGRQGIALHRLFDIADALEVPFTALVPRSDDGETIGHLRKRVRDLEAVLDRVRRTVEKP